MYNNSNQYIIYSTNHNFEFNETLYLFDILRIIFIVSMFIIYVVLRIIKKKQFKKNNNNKFDKYYKILIKILLILFILILYSDLNYRRIYIVFHALYLFIFVICFIFIN